MAWPEKIVPGQQRGVWGDKLRDWQQYVEDAFGVGAIYLSPIFSDATVKDDLYIEGQIFQGGELLTTTEAQDFKVHKDLIIQDDATIRGDIYVDGRPHGIDHDELPSFVIDEHRALNDDATSSVTLWSSYEIHWRLKDLAERIGGATAVTEALDFKVHRDLIVQDDATIKDDLYVDGEIYQNGEVLTTSEAQDFHVYKDLVVQNDGTVKQDLHIEGIIFAESEEIIHKSTIYQDQTIIDDLLVKGNLFVEEGFSALQDTEIKGEFTVYEDTTVKQDLFVEGEVHGIDHDKLDNFIVSEHRSLDDDTTSSVSVWSSKETHDRITEVQENAKGGDVNSQVAVMYDATVRDHLVIGDNEFRFPSVDGAPNQVLKTDGGGNLSWQNDNDTGGAPSESLADFWVLNDLKVQDDATVKGDFRVDGEFSLEATDYFIHNDATVKGDLYVDGRMVIDLGQLTVRDDMTCKHDLYVEGRLHGGSPLKVSGGLLVDGIDVMNLVNSLENRIRFLEEKLQ